MESSSQEGMIVSTEIERTVFRNRVSKKNLSLPEHVELAQYLRRCDVLDEEKVQHVIDFFGLCEVADKQLIGILKKREFSQLCWNKMADDLISAEIMPDNVVRIDLSEILLQQKRAKHCNPDKETDQKYDRETRQSKHSHESILDSIYGRKNFPKFSVVMSMKLPNKSITQDGQTFVPKSTKQVYFNVSFFVLKESKQKYICLALLRKKGFRCSDFLMDVSTKTGCSALFF